MNKTATTAAAHEIIRYSLCVILLFSNLPSFEGGVGVTNALLSIAELLVAGLNSYDRVDNGIF